MPAAAHRHARARALARTVKRTLTLGVLLLGGCGGGGATASAGAVPAVTPTPAPAGAPSPNVTLLAGSAVRVASDAFGPIAIGAAVYASADAQQAAPLAGATVVAGPQPVAGATAPPQLPAGDVSGTTDAGGNFVLAIAAAAVAPVSEPFVVPPDNVLGLVPPAAGYYVEVFAPGALPLHRFIVPGSTPVLRVSSASDAESAALAALNADRAAAGVAPLIFDETAEEVARLHAGDEAANAYTCHYDAHDVGPASRYAAAAGLGLTGENLALAAGAPAAAFAAAESAFVAERTQTPPGPHFRNVTDAAHRWAGLAAVPYAAAPAFAAVDQELVTPDAVDGVAGAAGYAADASCPPGIVANGS